MTEPIARGFPSRNHAAGPTIEWSGDLFLKPELLRGAVVHDTSETPLYVAAFVVESGAAGLVMAAGGRNYHPLILAGEAGLPTVAGVGVVHLPEFVTVDGEAGTVFAGDLTEAYSSSPPVGDTGSDITDSQVYVNVGYPTALEEAAASGADGIGLLRTEFAAVRALALNLHIQLGDRTVIDALRFSNEADVIYELASDPSTAHLLRTSFVDVVEEAASRFGQREVLVRTLDIAKSSDDVMGNRGIRRDVASGGHTIRLLGEAIAEVVTRRGDSANLGVILPLVSHYGQVKFALDSLLSAGLSLRGTGTGNREISFGWEIEQPAAAINIEVWIEAFRAEYGQPPHVVGIGTNDLTQFTIALGRDAVATETDPVEAQYLETLYNEADFSIVSQIAAISAIAQDAGTRVFLLGEAAARPDIAPLMFALGVTPSVSAAAVHEVRALARGAGRETLIGYAKAVANSYPPSAANAVHDIVVATLTRGAPPEPEHPTRSSAG